jgi:hypothetical protein
MENNYFHFIQLRLIYVSHVCGLVVRVPGCRSRGLGSIPSANKFSENGVHSAS